jgi:hypothetical protein
MRFRFRFSVFRIMEKLLATLAAPGRLAPLDGRVDIRSRVLRSREREHGSGSHPALLGWAFTLIPARRFAKTAISNWLFLFAPHFQKSLNGFELNSQ